MSQALPRAGAACTLCREPADRACTQCGRFFCPWHGGDRLVWSDSAAGVPVGGTPWGCASYGRPVLTRRAFCCFCRPEPEDWWRDFVWGGVWVGATLAMLAAFYVGVFVYRPTTGPPPAEPVAVQRPAEHAQAEREAARELEMAAQAAESDFQAEARGRYKRILLKYPGTRAAAEAERLLEGGR